MYAEVDAWEIAPRFSDLLGNTTVLFIQDRVKLLHPCDHFGVNGPTKSGSGGTVHLESGLLVEYDWYIFFILFSLNHFMFVDIKSLSLTITNFDMFLQYNINQLFNNARPVTCWFYHHILHSHVPSVKASAITCIKTIYF